MELRDVSLEHNQLTVLPHDLLSNLENLEILRLHGNSIGDLPATMLAGLSKLQVLRLEDNELAILPENIFDDLVDLRELQLAENRIAFVQKDVFRGLKNLTHLSLESNAIADLPDTIFHDLTNLWGLSLGNNRLASLPEYIFRGLRRLERLDLGNNELAELPNELLRGLTELERLTLEDNQLAALPDNFFKGLTNLRRLHLRGNPGSPLPGIISLEGDGAGRFKARVHYAAPIETSIRARVTNGGIDGVSEMDITIRAGSAYSDVYQVARNEAVTAPVLVDVIEVLSPHQELWNSGNFYRTYLLSIETSGLPLQGAWSIARERAAGKGADCRGASARHLSLTTRETKAANQGGSLLSTCAGNWIAMKGVVPPLCRMTHLFSWGLQSA